ncbi:Cro/Cl family transcriptional regulator [Vibrio chagasii]|uniref:Cro/Cl family transcriptional regulator n=1 Tax=Vibrio chagasii TaxID=170679 RepID=A0A7V7NRB4_9VIBR|nr:Cro/CI family transcriptional regulator [Vibrio chagasii]KAB0476547.1 Cro/Cl family transcriptional regulator [Vibrio chagasii]
MNKTEVIEHFGSKSKAAVALNMSKQAIGQWGGSVPELRQYQIEVITNGRLKSDFTKKRLRQEKC